MVSRIQPNQHNQCSHPSLLAHVERSEVCFYPESSLKLATCVILDHHITAGKSRYPAPSEARLESLDFLALRGQDNIFGDAPSRHPEDREVLHHLRVPGGPVRRVIEHMFAKPDDPYEEEQMARFLREIDGADDACSVPVKHGSSSMEAQAWKQPGQ